jgi:hypothetical protein
MNKAVARIAMDRNRSLIVIVVWGGVLKPAFSRRVTTGMSDEQVSSDSRLDCIVPCARVRTLALQREKGRCVSRRLKRW